LGCAVCVCVAVLAGVMCGGKGKAQVPAYARSVHRRNITAEFLRFRASSKKKKKNRAQRKCVAPVRVRLRYSWRVGEGGWYRHQTGVESGVFTENAAGRHVAMFNDGRVKKSFVLRKRICVKRTSNV